MTRVFDQEQRLRSFILPFVYVVFLVACARDDTTPHRFVLTVAGDESSRTVNVEVASTPQERQQGLMWRQALDPDWGMLFIFPGLSGGGFWMRNTYVPLDIAYIGADGTVLEIRAAQPLDETVLTPARPYRYVLEVNQGWFQQHGLGVGSKISLPDNLPQAR
jgi:uncharacterized membrane protein (UPF0127 family)